MCACVCVSLAGAGVKMEGGAIGCAGCSGFLSLTVKFSYA